MDTLKNIATDYTNFYANMDEISVITGDGAKRFAKAIKEDMCAEMNIKFLTIDPDKCDFANDEKASRAVVRTLQQLAQDNNMHIVVVIDKKQERMQGHLGVALDKKATTITTCNFTEDKNLHFVDIKIRGNVCPVDEIVKP